MRDKDFKELWEIRFLKIVTLEKGGFLFYRHLLRKNKELFEGTEAKVILEGIVHDELRHSKIARTLLKIARNKAGRRMK